MYIAKFHPLNMQFDPLKIFIQYMHALTKCHNIITNIT